jgi:hypothetical protein
VKRLSLALLLFLLGARFAYGAVAVDADSVASCTSCSSLSWSHTVGGSATLLVCGVHPAHPVATAASYTFNAVGLNFKTSVNSSGGILGMWSLPSPATGSHTVEITMSEAADALVGGCTSFTGAGSLGTAVTATGDATVLSGVSVTVPANGMAFGLGSTTYSAACVNEAPDTGNTERYELCADGGGGITVDGFAVSRTATGTVNWTNRPSGAYEAVIGVPINEAATATAARRRILISP